MSISSSDSFEMEPLFGSDDDDDMDINPFWSSDDEEEENEAKNKKKEGDDKENIERKKDLSSSDFKIRNRDSGIVLSETKDTLDGNNKSEERISQQVQSIDLNAEHKLSRNFSEGTCKVENKLYTIKDKSGKVVIEDDLSREYSRQKSSENNGKFILNLFLCTHRISRSVPNLSSLQLIIVFAEKYAIFFILFRFFISFLFSTLFIFFA